jgi:predicted extracellular nuclease/endonuclease I
MRGQKKLKAKNITKISACAAILCTPFTYASDLAISGVIDGPLTGGVPKAVKIQVINDIADLSQCGIGSANNGGGSDGQEFTFPVVSASAGDYLYIASESTYFSAFFGFSPSYVHSAANINGDDAIELFCNDAVVDVFGDINVDGSGQPWEYLDGWAHRIAESNADGSTFSISNWEFSGKNSLDGESDNATAATPFPIDGAGGGDTGGGDEGPVSGVCFNCPDLAKVADLASFDDATYYANVMSAIANGLSTSEIKSTITQVISQNHQQLSYSEVWTALTETDEDPENSDNVILLYKGTSIAKMSNGSGEQSSDPDNWNREHVWAKSHGFPNSSQEGYTDIHHLRPTDISVNSSRGNLDFDKSDAPLAEAPQNSVDGDSFEPRDEVKGDVARMVFYMDTRYQGLGVDTTPDLQVVDRLTSTGEAALGKLCRLIEWHNADPVNAVEESRNNSIYEYQGNRNPFIDHPEWVAMLFTSEACATDDNGGDSPGDSSNALIISEYIEGSSNNKAIELFNLSSADIDLASEGYKLSRYSNGGTSASNINLTGTISANSAFVVAHSSTSNELKAFADQLSGSLSHNGDDAYVLYKNDVVIDSFGRVGEDPGSEWGSDLQSTKDNTLVRKLSVTTGDIIIDDAFDPSLEWEGFAKDTFEYLGAHQASQPDDGDDTPLALGVCNDPATLISAIQGSEFESPLLNEQHIIEGVVTAAFAHLNGFFIQEESADYDENPLTSEALVVSSTDMPDAGSVVRVMGDISESYGKTQLTSSALLECGTANIAATELSLPFTSAQDSESMEGMYIKLNQPLTVSDTYSLGKYGELALSNGLRFIPTNIYAPGSVDAIALKEANSLNKILLDDAMNGSYPDQIKYPNGGLTANNTVRLGDTVTSLFGVVDYSYGSYRIVPTQTPIFSNTNPREALPTIAQGNIKVASMNVLNLFNGDGQGNGFPTSRGADNTEEFERQIAKTVAAIVAINADIVGLMELENDGVGSNSVLADLVNRLNSLLGENTYNYVNAGGNLGTDAIAVGFIYQPAQVSLEGSALVNNNAIFNRPALAQTFSLNANSEQLTVIVNHFKSKGGCGSASGDDTDQGDGQACWNSRRVAQANEVINWVNTHAELKDQADVLVLGDLNAYAKEDPIKQFTDNGYNNLIQQFSGSHAYSYSYGGEVGYLDHALASSALAEKAVDAIEWHINADEPIALDYNTEKKSAQQLIDLYSANAFRMSDHDPIIATFDLSKASLRGDWDGDLDVDINDVRGLIRAIQALEEIDMTFDLNADSIINILDARTMMTLCTRAQCAP